MFLAIVSRVMMTSSAENRARMSIRDAVSDRCGVLVKK
jgi:hypothetical protein